jgi:hypothetical protein
VRERERCTGAASPIPSRRSRWERACARMEGSVGAGALARKRECCTGGGCVRTEQGGSCGRRPHARHTPPKLSTTAHLHRGAWTPPPPRSHTSLLAPLEGDLPAFPMRSTSACAAPGHGHLPGPIHTRGATPVEASGVHALHRRGTAGSCRRRRGRGRCGGPARRGGRGW